ncbi:UNVERIFIED_CONTAM: hypothetical protein Sradi_2513800 [Sesamum radiatum]|uniref:RNase H type-1 domain-containing protein n=1 Tax=Sesamum radiatum TaxID=300843 RepID=A0AAW2SLF7_SESRA
MMIHSYREKGSSLGDHSQAIAPVFPLTLYKGKDEHAFEAVLRKAGYFRLIDEIGCRINRDLEFVVEFGCRASNNEVEYEALVICMTMTHDVGARHLVAYSDSQLIVKQVEGTYEGKEENMIHYLQQIEELKTGFESFQLIQIPREENVKVDCLSKLAGALEDCRTKRITIQHLLEPRAPLSIQVISPIENWKTPVIRLLEEGHHPNNRRDAGRLKSQATRSLLQGGVLYKKSFTHPLLLCLSQPEGKHVLR